MATSDASELMEALRRPFEPADLEWRAMFTKENDQGPLILVAPYVNRPAIVNRLNQVCGISGWQSDARSSSGHVYVGIGIRFGETWVWRWDGTGLLEPDPPAFTASSAGKGNFSNAFKRAAEQWGIALYLREVRPMRAIIDQKGLYKSKVGTKIVRWDPPPLQGKASYPGEIPGWDREEGGDPGQQSSEAEAGEEPKRERAEKAKPLTDDQKKAEILRCKDHIRAFMEKHQLKVYHLDAIVQTTAGLRERFQDAQDLGQRGQHIDWHVVANLAEGNGTRWEDATRTLAREFPTGPERLMQLDELMNRVKLEAIERVQIESAKAIGWNDAIEYWIETLGKR
jgi:hypothetical protein